ncbi:MAG: GldG family protein [Isosphaeraceae bacterium]|nr:GldG family protein [Isosphaeraceae bacterium]
MSESKIVEFLSRTGIWAGGLALAAFLALYWALRGAPLFQAAPEEEEAGGPSPRYRDRVVAGAIAGLMLLVAGAGVAMRVGILWSLPLFVAGFGLEVALIRSNHRYRHTSPTLRRVVQFADTALTATLLAGVLIVGNVLAFKYGERPLDLTREGVFSLESLTVQQLKSLKQPVRFTVFSGNSRLALKQRERVIQLLELYRAENPRMVRVEIIDEFNRPREFEELAKRVPDVLVSQAGGGVVVEYGEGEKPPHLVVRNLDMFEAGPSASELGQLTSNFSGEDALTSALIRLREGKRTRIAFTTGHGEPSIHDVDYRKPGLGLLRTRLEAIGAEILVHNPDREEIPSDVEVVLVVAPKSPFLPDAVDRLKAYALRGGHLVLLINGATKTGLEDWLKSYNVELAAEPIVDPLYRTRQNWPLAPIAGQSHHPIVEPLQRQAVIVPSATPLDIVGMARPGTMTKAQPNPEAITTVFLTTSPDSWAESDPNTLPLDRDAKDRPGPLNVGVAVAEAPNAAKPLDEPSPRLVVFSSPYLADNPVVAFSPANLDLVLNAIQWLRGRPDLQGLSPRKHVSLRLTADPGLQARMVWLPTILALCALLGLGAMVYLARRD